MSFEQQETGSSCGLAALRYAYSLLGGGFCRNGEVAEQHIRIKAGKSRWSVFRHGTSEHELVRAARRLGLTAKIRRFVQRDPNRALAAVQRAAARGHVSIVCVHSDAEAFFHWMVVAGFTGDRALVFDPAVTDAGLDERRYWLADPSGAYVPGLMSVERLRDWLDPGKDLAADAAELGEQHMFVEVGVAPSRRASFVRGMVDEALVRRMRRDLDLAASFDEYIDDLKTMFAITGRGELAHRFLRRHHEQLVRLATSWVLSAACDEATVRRELENLEALSHCYRFTVMEGQEGPVLASLAFWLGWTSATCAYEVGKFAA